MNPDNNKPSISKSITKVEEDDFTKTGEEYGVNLPLELREQINKNQNNLKHVENTEDNYYLQFQNEDEKIQASIYKVKEGIEKNQKQNDNKTKRESFKKLKLERE